MMQSNVVYRIYCKSCPFSYIGKTTRHLQTRINEHKKGEGGEYDPVSGTAEDHATVYNHQINFQHVIDYDGTKILARADNDFKLHIKEAYFIDHYRKLDHQLMNIQVNSNKCYLILNNMNKK